MFVSGKHCQPILMFLGKARSLPYSGVFERGFICLGSNLISSHYSRLERLARDKHSSLLRKSLNYGQKKVYNIGPRLERHAKDKCSGLVTVIDAIPFLARSGLYY